MSHMEKWEKIRKIATIYLSEVKTDKYKYKKIKELFVKLLKNRYNTNICNMLLNKMNSVLLGNSITEDENIYWACKVYDKLRYEFKLDQDKSILDNPAFDFHNMLKGIMYENYDKRRMSLIVGLTQSGKTFITIAISIIHLMIGNIPILILKDVNNKVQFTSRYKLKCIEIQEYLIHSKAPYKFIERFEDVLYCDSDDSPLTKQEYLSNLNKCGDGEFYRLVLGIKHFQHIERILNMMMIASEKGFRCVLMIDEAHLLGGYRKSTLQKKHESENYIIDNNSTQYDENIVIAKSFAYKVILITATFLDIFTSERELYPKGVVFVSANKNYRGFEEFDFHILQTKDEKLIFTYENEEFIFSKQKLEVFANIIKSGTVKRIQYKNDSEVEDVIPHIILDLTENINKNQNAIFNSFKYSTLPINDSHNIIIQSNPVVITQNQLGPHLYCNNLKGSIINIRKIYLTDDNNTGEFLFPKNVEIHEILQWLAINGGVTKFPIIIIIAYKAAEEGMTFSSTYDPLNNYNWHPTEMIISFGKASSCSRVVQRAGRMTGNHGDNIRPVIYCTYKEKIKIIKGYTLCLQVLDEIYKSVQYNGDDLNVMTIMQSMKIFKNRIPKNCFSTTKHIDEVFFKQEENPHELQENKIIKEINAGDQCMAFMGISRYTQNGMEWKNGELLKSKVEMHLIKGHNSVLNKTDNLRKILPEKIDSSTILMKMYIYTLNYIIETYGNGKWVARKKITEELMKSKEHYVKTEDQIKGHLRSMYQTKYTFENVQETTPGFLMKKEGNLLWIRIN